MNSIDPLRTFDISGRKTYYTSEQQCPECLLIVRYYYNKSNKYLALKMFKNIIPLVSSFSQFVRASASSNISAEPSLW